MKKILLIFCALGIFAGCVSYPKTSEDVLAGVKVSEDKFDKTNNIDFPVIKYVNLPNDEICAMTGKTKWGLIPGVVYNIRVIESQNDKKFLLMAYEKRTKWAFYRSAVDSDGKNLRLNRPNGNVTGVAGSVDLTEYFNISLSEDYLKEHRQSGFAVRVIGDNDTVTFHVPAHYIDGVLKYVESRPE